MATAFVAIGAAAGGGFGGGAQIASLGADTALVMVVVWLIGALLVAALSTERVEIALSARERRRSGPIVRTIVNVPRPQ